MLESRSCDRAGKIIGDLQDVMPGTAQKLLRNAKQKNILTASLSSPPSRAPRTRNRSFRRYSGSSDSLLFEAVAGVLLFRNYYWLGLTEDFDCLSYLAFHLRALSPTTPIYILASRRKQLITIIYNGTNYAGCSIQHYSIPANRSADVFRRET